MACADDNLLYHSLHIPTLAVGIASDVITPACTRCGTRDVATVPFGKVGHQIAVEQGVAQQIQKHTRDIIQQINNPKIMKIKSLIITLILASL